ncbi:MAG: phosphoenolpyruvate carboxykinase (ATP), partial [Alphaproteobacteria bacterium]|nr:phosphoenolpyruvate carboxykinase (ATP) [Alphaproteobacteria bacterium]
MNILERYTHDQLSHDQSSRDHLEETTWFKNLKHVHINNSAAELFQMAVQLGEGEVAKGGALVVQTGKHTGRSAADKFIVRDATTEDTVWWDANKSMTPAQFDTLYQDF